MNRACVLSAKEAEARKIYAGLDNNRRTEALNLFLLKFGDEGPVSLKDVSEYMLSRLVQCREDVLQCLCYFCQGYYLAETGEPLFKEDFLAMRNGPRCESGFDFESNEIKAPILYRGDFGGNPYKLTRRHMETVNAVIDEFSRTSLSQITEFALQSNAFKATNPFDIISKEEMKKSFRRYLAERKKYEFENHNQHVMGILKDLLTVHKAESLVKNVEAWAAKSGDSVEHTCTVLGIDYSDFLKARRLLSDINS